MEEGLPIKSEDLISELSKIFKEENSSQLRKRIKEGSLEFYLGTRQVVEFLQEELKRSQTDTEV